MSDLILKIPEDVARLARRLAEEKSLPVERILLDHLKTLPEHVPLPPNEETELAALRQLSDDTLWTIARELMPRDIHERMQVLMEKNNFGTITDEEYLEQAGYVDRTERLMLRKGEAIVILMERGYTVRREDLPVYDR
jgi:hypothetical protein